MPRWALTTNCSMLIVASHTRLVQPREPEAILLQSGDQDTLFDSTEVSANDDDLRRISVPDPTVQPLTV